MKLKEYNAENSKQVAVGIPSIRVARKSGTITFNKAAVQLIDLKDQSAITISNDEDSPRDWYVNKSLSQAAFKVRLKTGTNSAMFNCSSVAAKLLDTIKEYKSGSLKISKEPVGIDGVTHFLIITAKPGSY